MARTSDSAARALPRREQRDQTRRRIAEAAVDCFAERGFGGATTREIAARAGTNQGLITYHFQSKEALWRAAADHVFERARETLRERMAARASLADPRARARAFVVDFVRYAAEHPAQFRFLVEEGKVEDERMEWLVDRHLKPMYRAFVGFASAFGARDAPLGEEMLPHAFYVMAGAGSLIFAVVPECERLTGMRPLERAVVDRHAEFVASLLVPE